MQEHTTDRLWLRTRLMGLALIMMGLSLWYIFIHLKISALEQHQPEVRYSLKALVLVPFSLTFGAYYFLIPPSGSGAWKYLSISEKPIFIATMIASLAGMVVLFSWLNGRLAYFGYAGIF